MSRDPPLQFFPFVFHCFSGTKYYANLFVLHETALLSNGTYCKIVQNTAGAVGPMDVWTGWWPLRIQTRLGRLNHRGAHHGAVRRTAALHPEHPPVNEAQCTASDFRLSGAVHGRKV